MSPRVLALAVGLALQGCRAHGTAAVPPQPPPTTPSLPSLAPVVDVDTLVPPAPTPPPPDPQAVRFPDTPLPAGEFCAAGRDECQPAGPGVLVDEVAYTHAILDAAAVQRLRAEVGVLRGLRVQERAGAVEFERAMQAHLLGVQRARAAAVAERDQALRWRPWVFAAGWVLGTAAAALTVSLVR